MSRSNAEPRLSTLTALIVCDNDETLLGLRAYLSRASIAARATRSLADAWSQIASVDALVLFPDDFDTGQVTDGLSRVLATAFRTFVIVVTADFQCFESLVQSTGGSRAVVMPKPVWGWTILDLLRARLESRA